MKRVLVLFLLVVPVYANDGISEIPHEVMINAICAATNALVGTQTEGWVRELIAKETRRFAARVKDKEWLEEFTRVMGEEYNDGKISWEDLTEAARECARIP